MKVKIIRGFIFDKQFYAADTEVEFQDKEVEYINSTSLGQLVEVVEGQEADSPDKNYEKMTKKKLVEIANEKGIQVDESMTKKEIIEELV